MRHSATFNSLPDELFLSIFSSLIPQALTKLSSVSRIFYRLTRDNLQWYKLLNEYFYAAETKPYEANSNYFLIFQQLFNNTYHRFTTTEKKLITFLRKSDFTQITLLNLSADDIAELIKKWLQDDVINFRSLPQPALDFLYKTLSAQLPAHDPDFFYHGLTHLAWTLAFNQKQIIHGWIEKLKIDFKFPCNQEGVLPATLAVHLDRADILKDFIAHHLEIPAMNHSLGSTALLLHQAATTNSIEVAKLLIKQGPGLVTLEDKTGALALHIASAKGHLVMMTLLLTAAPASVNHATQRNETPITMAALNNKPQAISLLVSNGANIDAVERHNRTALFIAVTNGSVEAAERLLVSGANPNIADEKRNSALEQALFHHQDSLAQKLLAHGAFNTRKAMRLSLWNQRHAKPQTAISRGGTKPRSYTI